MTEIKTEQSHRWIRVWSAVKPRAEPCASRREFHIFNGSKIRALTISHAIKPRRWDSMKPIHLAWGKRTYDD